MTLCADTQDDNPGEPIRPVVAVSVRSLAGILSSASLLTLLAACAGTPNRPDIPVAQEAAVYRSHARTYYAPPGPADDPWRPYINEASRRFDVPDAWIRAVMHQESGGHQFIAGTLTTSPVGAMGLMQLMPPTYDDMRVQYSLGPDAFEPHDNIMAGTAYVRQMYDIYGSPGFLAAYNTGPGRLDDFLTRNRPLPRETRQYVSIIGPQIAGIWPSNRSQTDLLVASHAGNSGVMYASTQSTDQTHSVQMAWTQRRDLNQGADQPVQVAEAPASGAAMPAPAYTQAWNSVPIARPADPTPEAIAAARARPVLPPAPIAMAQADPAPLASSVSAAWAARNGTAPDPSSAAAPMAAPVAVAALVPIQRWTPAPTPIQAGGALPDPIPATVAAPAPNPVAEAPAPVQVASVAAPVRRHERFHLIRPAMAETAPLLSDAGRVSAARNWSIQVGAFGTEAQANQAADAAQSHAPSLSHARAEIAGVKQQRGGKVYRARLIGLSRGDAQLACERLSLGRGDCMVVSPDARS
ncbi:lytic transglycosylase domain-containing protein [Lichenicola cladoniae]|nr:lytic transglycosylase domain-containing protein [Lichenicola cladoniae]